MAGVTIAIAARISLELGSVPTGLAAAIGPLTAAQRDAYVYAWLNASDDQRARSADAWAIGVDDRSAFEQFRLAMTVGS